MIALAIALGFAALVLAVHDAFRRAIAADVRRAELRVEGQRRHDLEALAQRLAAVEAETKSLTSAITMGRRPAR